MVAVVSILAICKGKGSHRYRHSGNRLGAWNSTAENAPIEQKENKKSMGAHALQKRVREWRLPAPHMKAVHSHLPEGFSSGRPSPLLRHDSGHPAWSREVRRSTCVHFP
jgi:hypothetical protein